MANSQPTSRAIASCCGAGRASTSCIIRCATARNSISSPCSAPRPMRRRGDAAAYRAELENTYRDTHPAMRALIGMMDLRWRRPVGDRDPVRHWHKGRIVLLGDAAHRAAAIAGAGRLHGDRGWILPRRIDRRRRTAISGRVPPLRSRAAAGRRACNSNPAASGTSITCSRRHRARRAQRHRGRLGRGAHVRLPVVALRRLSVRGRNRP